MALPDVAFTNSLGTVTFPRCLIGISDQWRWDGQAVTRRKTVSIDGHIRRASFTVSPEGWEGLLMGGGVAGRGDRGELTLPWTTLSDVMVADISVPTGQWLDHMPISATFEDDNPDRNVYTLHFFELELHNPRLQLPVPVRRINDDYMQTPHDLDNLDDLRVQPMRFRSGYRMYDVVLSGTVLLDSPRFPADLVEKVQMRTGVSPVFAGTPTSTLPTGYPIPFDLQTAVPELSGVQIEQMVLTGAKMAWDVENQQVKATFNMLAQPQRYTTVVTDEEGG